MKQELINDDDYCFSLKKEWKNALPKYSDKELLSIFPEAKEIIPEKVKECEEAIREKKQEIVIALKRIYAIETDKFSESFGEEIIKMFMMPVLDKLEKNIFRLNHMIFLLNPTGHKNNRIEFGEKIEIARRYPIEELARNKLQLRQIGKNFVSLCPMHNEKTPSFYVYTETNRFYCYGCQEKGDVITLTMALYGIEFKEAVTMLQN